MSIRDLRNKLVFYLSAIGWFYVCKYTLAMGVLVSLVVALVAAIVSVLIIALLTDMFMD